MSSMARTLRRNGNKPRVKTLDEILFGSAAAPNDECLEERRRLVEQFRGAMRYMRAPNRIAALRALQKHYEDWDGQKSSPLCEMMDNIMALRSVEGELRKPKVVL